MTRHLLLVFGMMLGLRWLACSPRHLPPELLEPPSSLLEKRLPGAVAAVVDVLPPAASAPEPGCTSDAACGYDPVRDRCVADPSANRQPMLLDQGTVCCCEAGHCTTLRVPPVPCESDASCAVQEEPRPHPVAASAAHPHEHGRPCRDFPIATTCAHTNLCTLRRLACPGAHR